jgi:hypothetical protein
MRAQPAPNLLGHLRRRRRLVVLAQRVPKPMVQVIDRLAEVPFSSSWLQHGDALQPVPNPVGQVLRDLACHQLSFEYCEQADQRRQVASATASRCQGVRCVCAHAGSLRLRIASARSAAEEGVVHH